MPVFPPTFGPYNTTQGKEQSPATARHSALLTYVQHVPPQFLFLFPNGVTRKPHPSSLPLPLPLLSAIDLLVFPLEKAEPLDRNPTTPLSVPNKLIDAHPQSYLLLPCLGARLSPPSVQDSSSFVGVDSLLLLLFLVFPTFSPAWPFSSRHTDVFSEISASVSISFQTEPTFFYFLCLHLVTSHFFLASVQFGFYHCLIIPASVPRDLIIARLNEPLSVLISLGLL